MDHPVAAGEGPKKGKAATQNSGSLVKVRGGAAALVQPPPPGSRQLCCQVLQVRTAHAGRMCKIPCTQHKGKMADHNQNKSLLPVPGAGA